MSDEQKHSKHKYLIELIESISYQSINTLANIDRAISQLAFLAIQTSVYNSDLPRPHAVCCRRFHENCFRLCTNVWHIISESAEGSAIWKPEKVFLYVGKMKELWKC